MVRFYRIAVIANKKNSLICEIHPPKKACCALLTRNDNFTPSVSLKLVHSKKNCAAAVFGFFACEQMQFHGKSSSRSISLQKRKWITAAVKSDEKK